MSDWSPSFYILFLRFFGKLLFSTHIQFCATLVTSAFFGDHWLFPYFLSADAAFFHGSSLFSFSTSHHMYHRD